ncbi:GNAT family N-acetyltransferase [Salidesulfovibrio onnuriiensis]|uniref:GNAT family N-acetyltransferase n=1 Tax=Salidesulfovibrio onnuriiensis TaxID=2583823 RepID=UPI0011CC1D6F|nr:GNAT family N-acetyltransferase [Salidesulfovibrio onnuriiensis]
MNDVRIRSMFAGEEGQVSELVLKVFMKYVAPGYPGSGVAEFRKYASPEALAERAEEGNMILLAEMDYEPVGMIEVREESHICFFFVDGEHQGKGTGSALLREAIALCNGPDHLTVNSSPNSVQVYEHLGFTATDTEQEKNGIRYTPMRLDLG